MVEKLVIVLLAVSQLYLFSRWFGLHQIKIALLPGGITPKRQTFGAIGFDVHARCIVDPEAMDKRDPNLRKVLWDFLSPFADSDCRELDANIAADGELKGEFVYALKPGQKVVIGIGFLSEFPFPYFFWITPRSGLASRDHITVGNAPGTVDPDYRGEACVVLNNLGSKTFYISKNMRIAQIVFCRAEIPTLEVIEREQLTNTIRGSGGLGSTGV